MLDALALNFSNLVVLSAAVETGSLNRAAAVLGLTQPAVTRRIARLEEAVGCRLIERSAKGVAPTEFGRVILSHVNLAASELQSATNALTSLQRAREGSVICGGAPVSMSILFPAAYDFQKERPTESVQLIEGSTPSLIQMLKLGELDLAVGSRIAPDDEDDLVIKPLVEELPGVFVRADHPVTRSQTCSLGELLANEQWVLPSRETQLHSFIRRELERRELDWPRRKLLASSPSALRWFVERTDYLAISTSFVHINQIKDGTVVRLQTDWSFPAGQHVLYYRKAQNLTKASRRLVRWISSVANNLV